MSAGPSHRCPEPQPTQKAKHPVRAPVLHVTVGDGSGIGPGSASLSIPVHISPHMVYPGQQLGMDILIKIARFPIDHVRNEVFRASALRTTITWDVRDQRGPSSLRLLTTYLQGGWGQVGTLRSEVFFFDPWERSPTWIYEEHDNSKA